MSAHGRLDPSESNSPTQAGHKLWQPLLREESSYLLLSDGSSRPWALIVGVASE